MAKKRILALDPGGTLPADRGAVRGTRTARDLAIRRAGEGAWVMGMTGYKIGNILRGCICFSAGSDRGAWGRGRTHCVHWSGHWVGECE